MHELAELRSLALHREISRRLQGEGWIVERALQRVCEAQRAGRIHPEYAEAWKAWKALLEGPTAALSCAIEDPGERGKALRQTTPFTFVVPPRERWRIWSRSRTQWETGR